MKESEIRNRDTFNAYLKLVEKDVDKIFDFSEFRSVSCPACESLNHKIEFDKKGFTYVSCEKCGTLFINPRPTKNMLDKFYSNCESSEFWVEEFFKPVMNARMEKIFRPRAHEIIEEFKLFSTGRIGDIGAGFGLILEALSEKWIEAELIAIEPSISMAQECRKRGFKVIESMIEDVDSEQEKFDLLLSFELFEHLSNPEQFLRKCSELLNKDGRLLVTTLNGQGFDIQLLWENSKSVSPPHHLNFFNPHSIGILAERCGFEVESISTPGRLDWDIVEGMFREENVELPRLWKLVANRGESTKTSLQKWIQDNNLSSHMRFVLKKKD